MSLQEISKAIYASPISTEIRNVFWIIPMTQSLHILSVTVVVGAAIVMELHLTGLLARDVKPNTVVKRYLPWMWSAVAVLVATGITLTVAEPNRVLNNAVFWSKMILLLVAFTLTLVFRAPFLKPDFQLENSAWSKLSKPIAWTSLLVWIAVIVCGRWIAYAM